MSGFADRTVYRHAARLAEIGVVERDEEIIVPSKVTYRLAEPSGVEFCEMVDAFATAMLRRLRGGDVVPHSWRYASLLADLWEADMFQLLSAGPCTPVQLSRAGRHLSTHQVGRRIRLSLLEGLWAPA